MRDQGLRPVTLRLTGGQKVAIKVSYYSRNEQTARRGKGLYPALVLLGIHHRCTPALADNVAQLSAAMASFEEAQGQLAHQGVVLSVKTIISITYQYHTHWREPRLLIIYVVDTSGRLSQEFTPLIDGTMNGPEAIFALICYYLSELGITQSDSVLFIADGARWIWDRVGPLWRALGLRPAQCHELVDFYHVMEHLHKFAGLKRRWTPPQRRKWVRRQRRYLLNGKLQHVLEEIKTQTTGRVSKELRREQNYFLRNGQAGRLNYATVAAKQFPIGSGCMESSVRRVINLRLKGAGIFWHVESANAMLLLRSYYKAGRWKLLQTLALTSDLRVAA